MNKLFIVVIALLLVSAMSFRVRQGGPGGKDGQDGQDGSNPPEGCPFDEETCKCAWGCILKYEPWAQEPKDETKRIQLKGEDMDLTPETMGCWKNKCGIEEPEHDE
uniref:Uncharacterized protein n=1 Tax=Euplotes harpa TaxID=151035 RepID=A0A7S3N7X4_9SPIT|mmetsp:Transcript_21131/g.24349  ORF Transcript_21131/g.24349 Transcript_21131/m.24349 type:complete len:106 (+) Transcript_21131:35-352(+)|eukprot:CAMPEP_0168334884 /NCGR_PEP_ID=MMETSP0213-20121227/10564_1 /TAXON_ID=151035 /ORGANISM="Euplotes harpa, Strain FSP1.4" /LENGTH=105 /DNA_ID=CAMNT_0008339675 /DNA_START=1 /DNA_END=318 /DNA_ORIENTATION=+